MNFLQIRFGYLKLTSATPGLSNTPKLRFKSNIQKNFVVDIYRYVGVSAGLSDTKTAVIADTSGRSDFCIRLQYQYFLKARFFADTYKRYLYAVYSGSPALRRHSI